jgi:hypothetical protein
MGEYPTLTNRKEIKMDFDIIKNQESKAIDKLIEARTQQTNLENIGTIWYYSITIIFSIVGILLAIKFLPEILATLPK